MKHRSRLERAQPLEVAAVSLAADRPPRQAAAGLGAACSTLRGWRATLPLDGMPTEVAACWSTPEGVQQQTRAVSAKAS